MEALSNSLVAADIATTMHPYTNLRQHEKAGPLIISRGDGIRVYDERGKEYIEAATGLALSPVRIVFRHLLPNCLPPLIVVATVQIAAAIALEATLSFLGLGLSITEPSLGLLIANGFTYLLSGKYWISFFPGIALLLTIVGINLVGDQLRDVLNPRLQT